MSGVARLMLARGLAVSGSDAKESAVLRALAAEGAAVHVGHDVAHLDGVDTVVVSSAIRDDNLELAGAHARGLRVLHRSQALAAMTAGSTVVAVAGANGKTTTTSLLTVALQACGLDPSFAIGGELAKHATNAHLGAGDVFVVEADESDGSFLVYRPHVAVVTSVQPDHLDFYGDFATVRHAYRLFVGTIRPGGLLVVCVDDPGARELGQWAVGQGVRVLAYGETPGADIRVRDVELHGLSARATLTVEGVAAAAGIDVPEGTASTAGAEPSSVELVLHIPGRYNLQNATAAYAVAVLGLGASQDAVLSGLASFTGTRRRFEPRGQAAGVQVVDDYAHNAGKVAAVVGTARQLVSDSDPAGRLVVVFQPHLYSRTRDFAQELGEGLAPADVVVVMDVYAAREDPVLGVSGRLVADAVTAARPQAQVSYVPSWGAVAPALADLLRAGDLLLTVGAGDVTMVGPEVLRLLAERESARLSGSAQLGGQAGRAGSVGDAGGDEESR